MRRNFRCSSGLLQRILYEQLELRRRTRLYPWPTKIGIDEHLFKHEPKLKLRRFVTMIVDHKNKRLMEVVQGKSADELKAALAHIPGRENVQWVALDMSDVYRNFARDFFPNARLVADKFHVVRLISPAIHRYLKALGLPKEALPMYRVMKRNPLKLTSTWRWHLRVWLADKPALRELHAIDEALFRLYRTKGFQRASDALTRLTDAMALSSLPEVKTLRTTLMRWRREVLAYFDSRLSLSPAQQLHALRALLRGSKAG